MRKKMNRLISVLTAGVLTLGVFAPITEVAAASKNKVVEIPVNFTNTDWGEKDSWDDCSRSECTIWGISSPSVYSDKYTVSYKLYIPKAFIKDESAIHVDSWMSFDDATNPDEWKWLGIGQVSNFDMQTDLTCTTWDETLQKDVPNKNATVKKAGDFYVLTYKGTIGQITNEDQPVEVAEGASVVLSPGFSVKGMFITAKNSSIYIDDLKVTTADGQTIIDQNFNYSKKVEGDCHIAPISDWDKEAKELKLATITDNKVLTVKSTKATVKVGKKVKISATATPATKITYASSNKKVATVDAKGTVTGKKAGKATISVKANGKTVKVAITVKKK